MPLGWRVERALAPTSKGTDAVTSFLPIDRWHEGDWVAAIAAVALFAVLAIGGMLSVRKSEEVAGHPRGLFVLFYAEMWERFSYYGMRALLILYLTKWWLYDDGKSNLIYGAYTSLVYITPVLGGWLADRYLGQRKAVLFGGILLAFGHLLMAVEGNGSGFANDPTINVFWLALSFIGHPVSWLDALLLESVGQAIRGAAFAIPGSLGAQEGGYLLLAPLVGLTPDAALALSLAKRARELALGLPGLVYLHWSERDWQRRRATGLPLAERR